MEPLIGRIRGPRVEVVGARRNHSKKLGWLEWVGSDLKSEIESAAFARDGFTIVEVSGA